jgi:hypothetical protein
MDDGRSRRPIEDRLGSHFEIASFQVVRYNCTHEEGQQR